jgi:hypothetical protein
MSLGKATAAALLALLSIAAVTACASGGPASPAANGAPGSTRPAAPATTAPAATECAHSPSAMVGKALGLAVGKVVASDEGPVTVCDYTGRYEVLVRYQSGENASQFAQARQSIAQLHQSVASVPGLGDEAYFASYTATRPASHTLASRKDGIAVFVTSPASLGAERALVTELLGQI